MTVCPMCKQADLQISQHEDQPPVSECSECGGAWLRVNEYARWLQTQTPGKYNLENTEDAAQRYPVMEGNKAAVCPDCGHFLRKYRVAANIGFHLDRCGNCNGVWFDRNEWQVLISLDLQDEINQIFTQPWQKQIQDAITSQKLEKMYQERFGPDDYQKVREIRKWLQEHPNRNALTAYLLDKDPYSA